MRLSLFVLCAVLVVTVTAGPILRRTQQALQSRDKLASMLQAYDTPDKGDKIGNVPECKTKEAELLSKGDKGGPAPKPSDIKKVKADCEPDGTPPRTPPTVSTSSPVSKMALFEDSVPSTFPGTYSEPLGMCLPLESSKVSELESAISSGDNEKLMSFMPEETKSSSSSVSSSSSSSTSSSSSSSTSSSSTTSGEGSQSNDDNQSNTRFASEPGPATACRWVTAGAQGSAGFLLEKPTYATPVTKNYDHGAKKITGHGFSLFNYYTQLLGPVNCWAEENELTAPSSQPSSSIALSVYLTCTDANNNHVPPPEDCTPAVHIGLSYKGSAEADSYSSKACIGPEILGGIPAEVAAEATHEVSFKVGGTSLFHKVCGAKSGPQVTSTTSWSLGATGGAEQSQKDGSKASVGLTAGIGGSVTISHDFAKTTCEIGGFFEKKITGSILSAMFRTGGKAHLHTKSRGRGWSHTRSQEVWMGWAASASTKCKSKAASGYWGSSFPEGNQNQYAAFQHWSDPIMKASIN